MNRPKEIYEDDHVRESGAIAEMKHPVLGRIGMIGITLHLSKTPGEIRQPPPQLGEHTSDVLQELGYAVDDIQKFRQDGLVR